MSGRKEEPQNVTTTGAERILVEELDSSSETVQERAIGPETFPVGEPVTIPEIRPGRNREVEPERAPETDPVPISSLRQKSERTGDLNEIQIINSVEEVGPCDESLPRYSEKSLKNTYDKTRKANICDNDRDNLTSKRSDESMSKRYVRMQANKGPDRFIEKLLIVISYVLVVICFPISLFCVFVVVRQFERAVILRNGKVHKNHAFGPGLVYYLPCIDVVHFIDLRIICYAVPPQEALTKDSLTVSVDAVVFYKVCDPVWAVINVADYEKSTRYLAATTLRNALGTMKLTSLLVERPAVCYQVFQQLKRISRQWGIKVVRVEIKDISLPLQLQKAMAAEAESSRLANAKIIVAKSEIESTKNLQLATTLLMDNPLCMQLRYLQSLHMIAGEKTHTIVFPFSVEAIKKIFN